MTARGKDGATPNSHGKKSDRSRTRRTIRDRDRRSKLASDRRRKNTVLERHPARPQNEPLTVRKRRPRHKHFEVNFPLRLPITRDELDAVELLLGRSLRDLLILNQER